MSDESFLKLDDGNNVFMCWFASLNSHAAFMFLRTECYAKRCAVFDFISVALFFKFKAVWVVSSLQWMKQPIHCKMISSAVLALIHRDSHTQSCFLMALHTCRGYEQGINITRSTHFHLTLTSLFAPSPLTPPLLPLPQPLSPSLEA